MELFGIIIVIGHLLFWTWVIGFIVYLLLTFLGSIFKMVLIGIISLIILGVLLL